MLVSPRLAKPPEFITCEECGGTAILKRRTIDAFKRDGSEAWTFECVDCMCHTQRSKNPDSPELMPHRAR
jgi:hypothetical protein